MNQQILNYVSRYIKLTSTEEEEFLGVLQERKIRRKEYLVEPGEEVKCEYFVVKGCLRSFYRDQCGEDHIIQFAIEDWWTGDFEAFFFNQPSRLHIEAIEDSTLLALQRENLELLYEKNPKFERFFRLITTNAFVALRRRILSTLEKSGKERYLEFCASYPRIERRVPNAYIANYLGIKPESLSRIRKELV